MLFRMSPWLERMNLGHIDFDLQVADVPLAVLRLLDLARALARDPQLLMLDEITAALTTDQAEYVFDVMREWKDKGRSVLFISHRLGDVLAMCARASILRNLRGRFLARIDFELLDQLLAEHGRHQLALVDAAQVEVRHINSIAQDRRPVTHRQHFT